MACTGSLKGACACTILLCAIRMLHAITQAGVALCLSRAERWVCQARDFHTGFSAATKTSRMQPLTGQCGVFASSCVHVGGPGLGFSVSGSSLMRVMI